MDAVVDRPWTVERFLSWDDRQEARHEFDGRRIIPTTGGSVAHQEIVFNLRVLLARLLTDRPFRAVQEMRLQIGDRVRYPDVAVCNLPLAQDARTLTDAVAIFEVLSDDTATTDRVEKLIDYADVPSLRSDVLLEQTMIAATMFQREPGGAWIASPHTGGLLWLPVPGIAMPLAEVYRGLTFPADAAIP